MTADKWPRALDVARLVLQQHRPYLSSLIFSLQARESDACPTIGVDQYHRLYYSPDWLAQQAPETLPGLLYHEVLHLLRDHAGRRGARDPQAWNVAADAEINGDIREEKS